MRPEQIIADALEKVEHDRYKLSLLVSKRVDELFKGDEPLVNINKNNYKLSDIALMEIAEGKINLKEIV
jgi:DNA-directed RNA polymerase subunit omega